MSEQTAVTLLRELIESGKNFGDFIPKGPSLAPTGPQGPQRTHSNQGVPIRQVRVLMPRQGRFSEFKRPPAPSKNWQTANSRIDSTSHPSEGSEGPSFQKAPTGQG